jgi:kinetochore protein Spc7/SPC105
MLRITKVRANLFEYVYASTFLVSIPCTDFCPIVSKVRITRTGQGQIRYKDEFPKLSTFLLASANYLINEGEDLNVREVRMPLA